MHILEILTPFTLAAFAYSPTWSIVLMFIIAIVLIVLLNKELWSIFSKLQTGLILFIIISILTLLGGLLPQHMSQMEATMKLLNAFPKEGITVEMASQAMGLPHPGEIPPEMVARQFKLPSPTEITPEKAKELMGSEPSTGTALKDAYSGWLKREYNSLVVEAYDEWFAEKLEEGRADFKEAYKLDLFVPFYNIGFFTIYHTWYYHLLVYLFFITLVCCSVRRLKGYLKMRRLEPVAFSVDALKRRNRFEEFEQKSGRVVDAKEVAASLRGAGMKPVKCRKDGDGCQFAVMAGTKIPPMLSSILFHLAIFILLIGFLETGYYSWKTDIWFSTPGQSQHVHFISKDMKMYGIMKNIHEQRGWNWADPDKRYDIESTFEVRCDDYWVEYRANDDGWYDIRDWKSELVVLEDGVVVKRKEVEVNFPLIYRGIDFYQQSYSQTGVIQITTPGGESVEVRPNMGMLEVHEIPAIDRHLYCSGLVDGYLTERGQEKTELGPMVRLGHVLPPKKEDWPDPGEGSDDNMKGIPEFVWEIYLEDGKPVEWNGYTFELKGPYSASTGIEVRRDPGVPILWVGMIAMMIMMVIRIYFTAYDMRVDVSPGGRVIVAGKVYGLGANFARQVERIKKALSK